MKKLVFLHGAGADKNAYRELVSNIACQLNAELYSFNAPFPHPEKSGKFVWFNKFVQGSRRDAVISDYTYSLNFIKQQLLNLSANPQEIILLGHSQGGGMAVHVGLELNFGGVISVAGDLPYNISYAKQANTSLYWLECAKDTYINNERKKSYQMLDAIKAKYQLITLPNSTHTEFATDLQNFVRTHSF